MFLFFLCSPTLQVRPILDEAEHQSRQFFGDGYRCGMAVNKSMHSRDIEMERAGRKPKTPSECSLITLEAGFGNLMSARPEAGVEDVSLMASSNHPED